jgi:thiamine phosphate synthase YjbQ (UPF0047 family)
MEERLLLPVISGELMCGKWQVLLVSFFYFPIEN